MMALLDGRTFSARELSAELGIPEKEVCDHLTHVQKTMGHQEVHLLIEPAVCLKCGFAFSKRGRLNRPGKCPACKGQQISPPLFSIKSTADR
jgi:predicted Zn-ribbon and HTH transcriptional regulator